MTTIEQRIYEKILKSRELMIVIDPYDRRDRLEVQLSPEMKRYIASAYKEAITVREVNDEKRMRNALVRP